MSNDREKIPYKIYLEESEMPKQWYNVRADMKNKPAPLLNPGTHKPMTFDELRPVFCERLHCREQDYISYAYSFCHKHNHSVDTESDTTRWRHTVCQCI